MHTYKGQRMTDAEFWAMARQVGAYAAKRERQQAQRRARTPRMQRFQEIVSAAKTVTEKE